MDVRPYESFDRDACLTVFDSLTPALLDCTARLPFESWLANPTGPYFVIEHEESIVGCGGYSLSADRSTATARSSSKWGSLPGAASSVSSEGYPKVPPISVNITL